MINPFKKPTASAIVQAQIQDAERLYLDHTSAAEHHQALANMYAKRVARLSQPTVPPRVTTSQAA